MRKLVVRLLPAFTVVAAVLVVLVADPRTSDAIYFTCYAAMVTVVWVVALRRGARTQRRPWLCAAAAMTSWLCGDALQSAQGYLAVAPPVGASDVLWLAGYPVMAAALVSMARRRAPGQLRAAVLDGLALSAAAAAAGYVFLVEPILRSGYSVPQGVVAALYPFGDVVLLAAVLLLALSPGARGTPTALLLAASVSYVVTDTAVSVVTYVLLQDAPWVGGAVLLGNGLLVSALLHPGSAELTTPGNRLDALHPARVVFLGLALMTSPAVALLHSGAAFGAGSAVGFGGNLAVLVATATCTASVLTRFTLAVREQERSRAELAHQARHDALTGLANRAALTRYLERAGHLRPDGPQALLYLDLDGFKAVNDRHGHEAGDAVLVAVARRLSAAVRAGDLVARLGGDEFVIACEDLPADAAAVLAERVVREVAVPVLHRGTHLEVGASVGVAVGTGGAVARPPSAALSAADAAMYRAKSLGRGRWVMAP